MEELTKKYELQLLQIKEQQQLINKKMKVRKQNAKNINWGHIGDLEFVLERLKQINNFIK